MWKVISQEQIGQLSQERSIITILLARSMNPEFLRWLYDSWGEINEIAGARWHVVIPSHDAKWLYSGKGPQQCDFNSGLSLEIANSYGVSPSEMPCLIMEDFCEDAIPILVRIPENERDRAKLVDAFSEIVFSISEDDISKTDWRGRRGVNAEIARAIGRRQKVALVWKLLPKAVGAAIRVGFSGH